MRAVVANLLKVGVRAAALAAGSLLAACATAGIEVSDNMALGAKAVPPPGYVDMCRRLPARCPTRTSAEADPSAAYGAGLKPSSAPGIDGERSPAAFDWSAVFDRTVSPVERPASTLAMTPELWRILEETDRAINRLIIPASDIAAFGQDDYWAMPLTEGIGRLGNCKHYVLEKRAALLAAGVPESAMAIAVVAIPGGETHAVLVVATDQGEYVLDNLSPWVTPWRKSGYRWLVRQAPGDPSRWVTVANG